MPTTKRVARPKQQNDSKPEPAPAKPARKPHRPRIDSIVNAIVRGDYDDKLIDLTKAILQRNEARKAAVLQLVREVYGPDSDVIINEDSAVEKIHPPKPNPFKAKAGISFDAESSEANLDALEARAQDPIPEITSSPGVRHYQGPDDSDLDEPENGSTPGEVTITSSGGTGDGDEIISNSPQLS